MSRSGFELSSKALPLWLLLSLFTLGCPTVSLMAGDKSLQLVAGTGHTGPIRTFAYSPDGRHLATAGEDKRVLLWDTETGLELFSQSLPEVAHELVLGPQGHFLMAYAEQGRALHPNEPHSLMPDTCFQDEGLKVHAFSRESPAVTLVSHSAAPGVPLPPAAITTLRLEKTTPDGTGAGALFYQRKRTKDCLATRMPIWTAGQGEYPIALAPSGQELLVASGKGRVRLQMSSGAVLWSLELGLAVKSAAFASDAARRLAVLLEDGSVQVLDTGSGTALASARAGEHANGVTLSSSGQYVATYGSEGLLLWSVPTAGGLLQEEPLVSEGEKPTTARLAAFTPQESSTRLAVLQEDGTLFLMDVGPVRTVSKPRQMDLAPRELRLTANGQHLRVTLPDGKALWWDLREGALRDEPSGADAELAEPFGTGPELRWELAPWPTTQAESIVLRDRNDVTVGRIDLAPSARQGMITGVALSPERSLAVLLDDRGQLSIVELAPSTEGLSMYADERTRESLSIHDVRAAIFSPSGRELYVSHTDGIVQVWDMSTRTPLARLFAWPDGRWAVADSEGRFDAANGGEIDELYWVLGLEPIALSQLKSRYYEPFLLARLLGFQDEPLREVNSFTEPKLYPRIQAQVMEEGAQGPRLHLTLQARDEGGIGRTLISFNGKELIQLIPPSGRVQSLLPEAAKAVSCTWTPEEASCDVLLTPFDRFFQRHAIQQPDGQKPASPVNLLSIQAYNAEEYLLSRPKRLEYVHPSARGAESVELRPADDEVVVPKLWAVVAGASDYKGNTIDLRFAAKDADDVARALDLTARRLLCAREDGTLDERCDRVHIRRLSTTSGLQDQCLPPAPPNAKATVFAPDEGGVSCTLTVGKDPCRPGKSNLLQALEELEGAAPEDIVVIYLAGHGATFKSSGQETYHYLTSDAGSLDMSDPELRCRGTLSSGTLSNALRRIPARKQVLILDTCHAGAMVLKMTGPRGLSSSQVRAMEQMQDQTGMYVLAGAPSDAVSYESSEVSQGLLTYALLRGMVDKEGLTPEALVDVGRLLGVTATRARLVARGMNRLQRPVVAMPQGGGSFYIGQMKEEEQKAIQSRLVLEPRPRFTMPDFHEGLTWKPEPKLRDAVASTLRARSESIKPELAFVEEQDLPGAFTLLGTLETAASGEATISRVTAKVFQDGKQVGCTFQAQVPASGAKGKDSLTALAEALVTGALQQVQRAPGTPPAACWPP